MKRRFTLVFLIILLLVTVAFTGCFGSDDDDDSSPPPNSPPVAFAGYDKSATVDETVYFDGTGSYDPNGDALSYSWSFGDGSTGTGTTPTHTYSALGTYTVTLTITANGDTASDSMIVTIYDGSEPTPSGNKWAVIIGILNYPARINDLYYPLNDANDWKAYLEGQGYSCYMLLDNHAKKNKIFGAIDWMRTNAQPGDSCAFIYSGHGVNYNDIGYSGTGSALATFHDYVFDYELGDAFANFPTDKIFFFFDCCRSGNFNELNAPGRFVAEGCGVNEYTYDGEDYMANGVFTYYFVEKALGQLGYSSLEDAYSYAYNKCASSPWYFHPEKYDGDQSQPYVL